MVQRNNAGVRKAMSTRGISRDGINFLKCAFAAPDFDGSAVYGVPDDFGGKSLAIKHRAVNTYNFLAGNDVYFLLAPVPGICYYILTKPTGIPVAAGDVWIPVTYANFDAIFGTDGNSVNKLTQKYRMVSSHFELVPCTNNTQWTGNITAWKIPLQMYEAQTSFATANATNYFSISGMEAVNKTDADMYSGPFNLGVYGGVFNRGAKFDFNTTLRDQLALPNNANFSVANGDFCQLKGVIPGFDNNFESMVVRIGGVGVNDKNTCLLKSWSCIEYQFSPGSVMYESQILHTTQDPLALAVYKKVCLELPIGVSYMDNAGFWERVLGILSTMGIALSAIPGPYGAIAGGVGAAAAGLRELVI